MSQRDSYVVTQSLKESETVNQPVDCVVLYLEDKRREDEADSPPKTSLFLCPSNLSGILETATALSLGVTSGGVPERVGNAGNDVCESPATVEGCVQHQQCRSWR